MSDTFNTILANDIHSSFKKTPRQLRIDVENYFIDNYNLTLIKDN